MPEAFQPQKLVELTVSAIYPEAEARLLNEEAASGYRFGGGVSALTVSGGGMYTVDRGLYTDAELIWLNKTEGNSLFHAWKFKRERENFPSILSEIVRWENSQRFKLVQIIPLDGFPQGKAGMGTFGYFLLFERSADCRQPLLLDYTVLTGQRESQLDILKCPVIGCDFSVPASKGVLSGDAKANNSCCPKHQIYLSANTFKYADTNQALLWSEDRDLIEQIMADAKKDRDELAWEGSVSAIVLNVFRYLERHKILGKMVKELLKDADRSNFSYDEIRELQYWSTLVRANEYAKSFNLAESWAALGGTCENRPTPDVLIGQPGDVVLIKAGLDTADIYNAQIGSFPNTDRAIELGHEVFKVELNEAIESIGGELTALFLAGKAMAGGLNFQVVYLSREKYDAVLFRKVRSILVSPKQFVVITWQQIYNFIAKSNVEDPAMVKMLAYLRGKTVGYVGDKLQLLLQEISTQSDSQD